MSTINPYLKEYKKNQIETATPEQILILLYDGAIQYLNKAKMALDSSTDEQLYMNLLGCEKIILEFMNTLDMELGGALAVNLYNLYEYLYNTLVNAGINKNRTNIDEVLKHLTSLRETWQKAIEIANAEKEAKLIDSTELTENAYNNRQIKKYEDEQKIVYEGDGYYKDDSAEDDEDDEDEESDEEDS